MIGRLSGENCVGCDGDRAKLWKEAEKMEANGSQSQQQEQQYATTLRQQNHGDYVNDTSAFYQAQQAAAAAAAAATHQQNFHPLPAQQFQQQQFFQPVGGAASAAAEEEGSLGNIGEAIRQGNVQSDPWPDQQGHHSLAAGGFGVGFGGGDHQQQAVFDTRQWAQINNESEAILADFASELLSDTNFASPSTCRQEAARITDVTFQELLTPQQQQQQQQQPEALFQVSPAIKTEQLEDESYPPELSELLSCAATPSPAARSGFSSDFFSSDVGSPDFTEDFDEMSLIPVISPDGHSGGGGGTMKNDMETDSSPSNGRVCPVCGNTAGKHSYYGGNVCNSCRAFFRRSVQNKAHPKFACKKDGQCMINSRSWKSCQFCRFQKCVEAGMKVSWVLTESERKERAKQRAVTKRKKQERMLALSSPSPTSASPSPAASPTPAVAAIQRAPEDLFTAQDQQHIRTLIDSTYDFLLLEICKFYSRHLSAFDEVMSSLYRGTILSLRTQRNVENFVVYSVKNFYRGMGDMMHLSPRDQNVLVSKNYPLIMEFISSIFIGSSGYTNHFFDMFVKKIRELPLKPPAPSANSARQQAERNDFKVLEAKFEQISLSNSLEVRPIEYEQLYPDQWISDRDAQDRFRELCFKVRDWPRDRLEETGDEIQMMLMGLVMLFSTDFIELDDPSRVAGVQAKYGNMLYRYLKFKYGGQDGKALSKFCQGMVLSSLTREMREIKDLHWKNS